jgi:hypothetical protein
MSNVDPFNRVRLLTVREKNEKRFGAFLDQLFTCINGTTKSPVTECLPDWIAYHHMDPYTGIYTSNITEEGMLQVRAIIERIKLAGYMCELKFYQGYMGYVLVISW